MNNTPARKHTPHTHVILSCATALIFIGCSSGDPCPSGSSKVGDRCVASETEDAGSDQVPEADVPPPADPPPPEVTCLAPSATTKEWKPAVRLSGDDPVGVQSRAPVPATDYRGNAIVLWGREIVGNRYDMYSNRYEAGKDWGAAISVEPFTDSDAHWQKITGDIDGRFVAAWNRRHGGPSPESYTMASELNRENLNWNDPQPLQPLNTKFEIDTRIFGNRRGMRIAMTGQEFAASLATKIFLYRYAPTIGWQPPTQLSQDGVAGFWQHGWLDTDGSGFVAWGEGSPLAGTWPTDGILWTRDLAANGDLGPRVSHGSMESTSEMLTSGTENHQLLVWRSAPVAGGNRTIKVQHRKKGESWSSITVVDGGTYDVNDQVTLVSNGKDHAYLIWNAADPVYADVANVRVSSWNDQTGTWSAPTIISEGNRAISLNRYYSAGVDEAGNLLVGWLQRVSGNPSNPFEPVVRMYSLTTDWGPVTTLAGLSTGISTFRVAMDCGGNAIAVWEKPKSVPPGSTDPQPLEVWVRRYE